MDRIIERNSKGSHVMWKLLLVFYADIDILKSSKPLRDKL